MAERPILFSGPLVRAILAGRKTETRRLVTPFPEKRGEVLAWDCKAVRSFIYPEIEPEVMAGNCPLGSPGDTLWVRETWQPIGISPTDGRVLVRCSADGAGVYYASDEARAWIADRHDKHGQRLRKGGAKGKWPSIFMPRWASRISLRVVDVRAERLQEIDDDAARAEGITHDHSMEAFASGLPSGYYRSRFRLLWDQINGKREGATWASNPWVWVLKFEVAEVRR